MKLEKVANILDTLHAIENLLREAMEIESNIAKDIFISGALEKTKKVRKEVAESNVQII